MKTLIIMISLAVFSLGTVEARAQGLGVGASLDVVNYPGEDNKGRVFAAKFLCGELKDSDLLVPGIYRTAINVHNRNLKTSAEFRKKAVSTKSQHERKAGEKGIIGEFVEETLKPNEGLEVDCTDIRNLLGNPADAFLKGFVVIRTISGLDRLDVTGVYTLKNIEGGDVIPIPADNF